MNKHRLLETAEYISILAVLTGSTIAVTTGKTIYATVPIALSFLVNLIRRSQLEQLISRSSNDTYQQIINSLQLLHTEVMTISSQKNSEQFQQYILLLSEKIELLQTDIKSNFNDANIFQIQSQCQNLQETLNSLTYRMLSDGVLSSCDPKPVEKGIANIISQYQNYKQEYRKSYSAMLPENLKSDDLEDD